jgi:hypothetical protein
MNEKFQVDDVEWERWNYGTDDNMFQRVCDAKGCDRGLLLAPARDCWKCGGSGYLIQRNDPRELEKETQ